MVPPFIPAHKRGVFWWGLENDAEHSYSLAMLAWYLIDTLNLPLNKELCLKYVLVHDVVEVYAGDTYIFDKDETHKNTKEERERESAQKLKKEFQGFSDLHAYIQQYEAKSDDESVFIYALDKLAPVLTFYLDQAQSKTVNWKLEKVTLQKLTAYKQDKIARSPAVKKLWDELRTLLEKEEAELFYTPAEL